MLSRFKKIKLGTYAYFSFRQVVAFSAAAVFIILIAVEKKDISFLLAKRKFYETWIWHAIIAILVIYFVLLATRILDYRHPWQRSIRVRTPLQLYYGVGLAIVFTVMLVAGYYAWYQKSIFKSNFFRRYLFYDVLLILVLNAILFFKHQTAEKKAGKTPKVKLPLAPILINHPLDDIAYFYAQNKRYYLIRLNGERMHWPHTLVATMLSLPIQDFFLVHRSYIVNRKAILEAHPIARRIKLKLLLHLHLTVYVSKEDVVKFNQWWEEKKK